MKGTTMRAPLPNQTVQDKLSEAIELATMLVEVLRQLNDYDSWQIWNEMKQSRHKMPGYYSSYEFLALSRHVKGRLIAVRDSFESRKRWELEKGVNGVTVQKFDILEDIKQYAEKMLHDRDHAVREYGTNLLHLIQEETPSQ